MKVTSSQDKLKIIQEIRSSGLSRSQIAKKHGLSRITLYNWQKKILHNKSLDSSYKCGKTHYKALPARLVSRIIRYAISHPELSIAGLHSRKLFPVSYFALQKILERQDLNKMISRQILGKKMGVYQPELLISNKSKIFTADIKKRILNEGRAGKFTIQEIAGKYGLSRITIYNWQHQLKNHGTLENRYKKGNLHYKVLSQDTINAILDTVILYPQYSVAGLHSYLVDKGIKVGYFAVQKVLERYQLNEMSSRLTYSQKYPRVFLPRPTKSIDSISVPSLDQLSPNVMPGPPPPLGAVA
ncbi:MAG: helix-turn-helix domain-containing protein, partial [Patescibacteria group bacterium]